MYCDNCQFTRYEEECEMTILQFRINKGNLKINAQVLLVLNYLFKRDIMQITLGHDRAIATVKKFKGDATMSRTV